MLECFPKTAVEIVFKLIEINKQRNVHKDIPKMNNFF